MSRQIRYDDRVPTGPFQDWIEARIERYERMNEFGGEKHGNSDAIRRTAYDLGLDPRSLNRYRRGVTAAKPDGYLTEDLPTDSFSQERVEELLWHAGVFIWEVYPEMLEGSAA